MKHTPFVFFLLLLLICHVVFGVCKHFSFLIKFLPRSLTLPRSHAQDFYPFCSFALIYYIDALSKFDFFIPHSGLFLALKCNH